VQAISWVMDHSRSRLGARLVLLSIANHAHADGTGAYPSKATIGREAGLSPRQVQRLLPELVALGELEVAEGKGPGGAHLYTLPDVAGRNGTEQGQEGRGGRQSDSPQGAEGGDKSPGGGDKSAQGGETPVSPEPSTEPSGTEDLAPAARPWIVLGEDGKKQDLLWEAVMEACGIRPAEIPGAARGKYNRRVEELRDLGASPDEARRRASNAWFKVTPDSLVVRWAELDSPVRRGRGTVSTLIDRARRS
jgi:hypothetical protein